MSEQLYNDQTLTQYLLGSLSEAETERLDELSLTDDEVAEALQVVEHDLVDTYVQDELSDAARAQFKSYYLASTLRREKVAFAQALQAQAVKSLATRALRAQTETAAEVAPKRKGQGWFFTWRGFKASRPAWRWGAAVAALALLIAGSWLTFERVRPRQQIAQTQTQRAAPGQREQESQKESENQPENQPTASAQSEEERARAMRERLAQERTQREQQRTAAQPRTAEQQRAASQQDSPSSASGIVSVVLAPQMRGASTTQTISIPPQTAYVAVRLNLEPNEFSTYRVTLLDETGGQTLWRSSQLKARAAGGGQALNLSFRARLLQPQTRYVLRVTGGTAEIVDDYSFRVVK